MFLLNSCRARFTAAASGFDTQCGTPSPEVTGSTCLVPERVFSRAPLDIVLVYLCRFGVRFPCILLRGFSWQRGIGSFPPYGVLLCASALNAPVDLPAGTAFRALNVIAIGRPAYPSASPHRQTTTREVRNVNRMSISYAFRPRLRDRLTLSGLTFLRKP